MGLHGQFAQSSIGQFQRLTLRTKGRVPQTGATCFIRGFVAQTATTSVGATAVACIAFRTACTRLVTKTSRRRRFGFLLTGSVVTSNGHHFFDPHGFRWWCHCLLRLDSWFTFG